MSEPKSPETDESVVAERRVASSGAGDGGGEYRATVDVRGTVDAPLVARLVDDLPGRDGVDGIRLDPETEPPRWTVEDGRLIFETLLQPDRATRVAYDARGDELAEGTAPVEVALAQPLDIAAVDADADVPAFRDAQAFDAGRAGEFIAIGADPADAAATGATSEDADGGDEATDDDVRRALRSIAPSSPEEIVEDEVPTIDLADPPDADGEEPSARGDRPDA